MDVRIFRLRLPFGVLVSLPLHAAVATSVFFAAAAPSPGGSAKTSVLRVDPDPPIVARAEPEDPPPPPEAPDPVEAPADATDLALIPPESPPPEPADLPPLPAPPETAALRPPEFAWSSRPAWIDSSAPVAAPPSPAPAPARPAARPPVAERPASAGAALDGRPAVPAHAPRPEYPAAAVKRGLEGLVVVLAEVGPDGDVEAATVKESSGHRLLDQAACRAVRRWRFEPARAGGCAIAALVEVPFKFRLTD